MHSSPAKFLAAATTCLLATACTGGTSSSSGDKGTGGTTTLRYLIEEPEDAEALQALKDHLKDFTKKSGVKVDVSTLDFNTMRTVLQTQLRSTEGPDVFNWGSGPSFGGALAEAGLLYDLTDAYAAHDWKVYDFAKERVSLDGKIYGIPGEMETIGIFYNADIFAKQGIDPPESLADLQAASEKLRDAGITPMAVGDKEGWEGGHLLSMALSSAVGSNGMQDLLAGDASWESPEVVEALSFWKKANENGLLPESPTSVDYDTSLSYYYTGDAAMIPTGSWLVGEIDDSTDFETGYIPFPGPDGKGIFAGGLGSGPFVSATTDAPEAAIELLDFLASEEHGQWTVENFHTIPPMPIDTSGLDVSPLFSQVLADIAGLAEGGDFGVNIDVLASDAFNEAMLDGMQAVLTDQATPKEVAAKLQAAAEK
ncbi:MAG: extracellular solute-binding protein family 1 [Blastococcus sp.]|jgi:raffinose/stachyose/melibiose transport system substrate-binding protein|nr:extracellular solute-binding protein family 1 [Blastococcus sp.]